MMRVCKRDALMVLLAGCVLLGAAGPGWAIPPDPDNAALLYYQGFLSLAELDDGARELIGKVAKGEVAPDDAVREHLGACRGAISFAEAAAEVPTCHWGFRFSQGFDALMPQLAQLRFLTFVLVADARVRAADGDYRGALERCLMTDTLAGHVGDDTLVSYLVSLALRRLGYKCMMDVVGQASDDTALLEWLKGELLSTTEGEVTFVRALRIEKAISLDTMRMENAEQYARAIVGEGGTPEEVLAQVNEAVFAQARKIYADCIAESLAVVGSGIPYDQALPRLKKLANGFDPNDPASAASGALMPAVGRIYDLRTRSVAQGNALRIGVELCLRRAKTGRLPKTLPAGMPKDPFSGEDFEYERMDAGFVLRCRGDEKGEEIVHEYAFTLK